ncbi:hypothetical protein ACTXLT_03105 [Brachybacterium alimentarium]|uniref:hypothetical protein n=1 Tax=Brachybacterium alimentarium TaxID=47845 RepID=UPI00403DE04B
MVDDDLNPEDTGDSGSTGAEMSVGEYRRMAARIEKDGRDVFSSEELERFDAMGSSNAVVAERMQRGIVSQMPDVSEAIKGARTAAMKPWTEKWKSDAEDSVRDFASRSRWVPPVDEEWMDSLAEGKQEEVARQVAQVDALELIAGHLAEVKAEQKQTSAATQVTATEVQKLRDDGEKTGRWTIGLGVVSAVAASVAAVFAVLVYLYPPS